MWRSFSTFRWKAPVPVLAASEVPPPERPAGATRRLALEREIAFLRDYARRLEDGAVPEGARIFRAGRVEPAPSRPEVPEGAGLFRKAVREKFCATGLTREQSFALEVNCLLRLNRAEEGRARRHVPLLVAADPQAMSVTMTEAGRSLDRLADAAEPVVLRDLPGQVEAIVGALERAGVAHLDLDSSGKNLTASPDGTLSLIDFDYAVLDRVPWSARMREALARFDEAGGYGGAARRILKAVAACPGVRAVLLLLVGGPEATALLEGAWPGLWEPGRARA